MKNDELQRHQLLMKQILLQCFRDKQLLPYLAFKGGTCLYFFYNLPRFSVDLDFDWLSDSVPVSPMTAILNKYFKTLEFSDKKSTWFWVGSYQREVTKIKIEVNKRRYAGNSYKLLDFYGINVRTLKTDCILAHKLCAITDRRELKNRDLFDAWWMLEQRWAINARIIEERMGVEKKAYLAKLVEVIRQLKSTKARGTKILDGLGQLLADEGQRRWIREHLLDELELILQLTAS
jgi:predicted nucleotidyltransferase component of viral defense system